MSNRVIIKKILELLMPYKKAIIFIMGCLLISAGLNLLIPILGKTIMDKGFIGKNQMLLINLVILTFLLHFLDSMIAIIKEKKRIQIAAGISYSLSKNSYEHLMNIKIQYFSNTNYAEILNSISTDIIHMSAIADESMLFVITQAVGMIGGMIGLLIINIQLTLIVLLFIPVKYVIIKQFAKKRKGEVNTYIEANREYAKWFGDSIGGVREVRLFGIHENNRKNFDTKQSQVIACQKKLSMLEQWNNTINSIIIQFLVMFLYIIGADMVFHLQLSLGSIFAFITYSAYVTAPISSILNIGYLLSDIIPSTRRYYEFMELEKEGKEEEEEEEEEEGALSKSIPYFGNIELRDVFFSYHPNREILKGLNFTIKKGSKVALIGQNGSGKSTIIDLLLRMQEADSGRILLDGKDIKDVSLEKYRKLFAVVSQKIYLFNDTIFNNINLHHNVESELMEKAVFDSGLYKDIRTLSYDYIVGNDGNMLSGGQKQKIALARALILDRPILIFDEATSNTDTISEQHINSLLKTRLREKTVIIATHKISVLSEMDFIIVLNEGRIDGVGSLETLTESNCLFKKLIEAGE
jgi:ATP-binding cassette subfamily B protein